MFIHVDENSDMGTRRFNRSINILNNKRFMRFKSHIGLNNNIEDIKDYTPKEQWDMIEKEEKAYTHFFQ